MTARRDFSRMINSYVVSTTSKLNWGLPSDGFWSWATASLAAGAKYFWIKDWRWNGEPEKVRARISGAQRSNSFFQLLIVLCCNNCQSVARKGISVGQQAWIHFWNARERGDDEERAAILLVLDQIREQRDGLWRTIKSYKIDAAQSLAVQTQNALANATNRQKKSTAKEISCKPKHTCTVLPRPISSARMPLRLLLYSETIQVRPPIWNITCNNSHNNHVK